MRNLYSNYHTALHEAFNIRLIVTALILVPAESRSRTASAICSCFFSSGRAVLRGAEFGAFSNANPICPPTNGDLKRVQQPGQARFWCKRFWTSIWSARVVVAFVLRNLLFPDDSDSARHSYSSPCSFGLSGTSQHYFSLRTNQHQPPAKTNMLRARPQQRRPLCRRAPKSASRDALESRATKSSATRRGHWWLWLLVAGPIERPGGRTYATPSPSHLL
jgi:hypothetical protein